MAVSRPRSGPSKPGLNPEESTVDEALDRGLTRLWSRVAANAAQSAQLHEVLRAYGHQSRNLLHSIKMSLYLASRTGPSGASSVWSRLERLYLDVERAFDRLRRFDQPASINPVRLSLSLLLIERKGAWAALLAARGRRLVLEEPREPPVGDYDPTHLGAAFDDVVAWRVREDRRGTDLRISWKTDRGMFQIDWDEPVQDAPRGELVRARETIPSDDDSDVLDFLTVPLLSRVASMHGGNVEWTDEPRWRLSLSWPIDVRTNTRDTP